MVIIMFSKKYNFDVFNNVDLNTFKNKRVALLAGHYCISNNLSDLSNFSESEFLSFKSGIFFYKMLIDNGVRSNLYLWINDIGINPDKRAKIKENFIIPDNYKEILDDFGFLISDVTIIFESSTRNKAIKTLTKSLKNNPDIFKIYDSNDKSLVRCVDNQTCQAFESKKSYTVMGPDDMPLVMRDGDNPKCNLILAVLFKSISDSFKNDIFINFFNDIYINRIYLGVYVFDKIFYKDKVFLNYYCDENLCYLG
jgi:hypothetical protein